MKSEAEPYLIDFAQAVLKTQPNAQMFLEKDAGNFARYFGKLGIKVDAQKILAQIIS